MSRTSLRLLLLCPALGAAGLLARADEPAPAAAAPTDEPVTRTFTYKTTKDGPLEVVVHYPRGWKASDRRPAIVFFFGGGWTNGRITQFETQAEHLARRGMVAARADYRVKSRQNVTPDRCVEDAKSAVRWLRAGASKFGIDPDRIVSAGGSAGGHLAACTSLTEGLEADGEDHAVSSRPNALVLFNPVLRFEGVDTLMERIGNDAGLGKKLSPTLHVTKNTPPAILFYGADDRLLPQGEEYVARARELGFRAEMFTAPGVGHGFFNRDPWKERTTARMDEFLVSINYLPREAAGSSASASASSSSEEGWVGLFDGKTLEGWTVRGGSARYTVADGNIVGTTVEGSANTFLCKGDFADFVLEVEVRCDPELNSGIQVRSHVYEKDGPDPVDPKRMRKAGVVYGPQCEIARLEVGTAGRFYDEARRGRWINDLAPAAATAFRDDDWNRYRIVVQGNRYRSWINGIAASDFTDDLDTRGFIGLQVHGIKTGTGPYKVQWRNVRLRELKPGESVQETP
jgi:acetyl esterase/lipase